jgi:hypothetical protein
MEKKDEFAFEEYGRPYKDLNDWRKAHIDSLIESERASKTKQIIK